MESQDILLNNHSLLERMARKRKTRRVRVLVRCKGRQNSAITTPIQHIRIDISIGGDRFSGCNCSTLVVPQNVSLASHHRFRLRIS